MAINRAPFNALVDDDGSGLTGTIWNKTQIQTVILDPADVAYGVRMATAPMTGGTYHNFDPGIVGSTIIEASPAGTVNITGFKPVAAPFPGQQLVVTNASSQTINFIHEDPGSVLGYRLRLQGSITPIAGFWAYAVFMFASFTTGGFWLMIGYRNGHFAFADVTGPDVPIAQEGVSL